MDQDNVTTEPDGTSESPFYIAATGSLQRTRQVLKRDDTFLIVDCHGDLGAVGSGGSDGLYECDTRLLSRLEMTLDGASPLVLGCEFDTRTATMQADLTNADVHKDDHIVLKKDTIHILRRTRLEHGGLAQCVEVRSFGHGDCDVVVRFHFVSDFADIFEVRGQIRARRGVQAASIAAPGAVDIDHRGLSGTDRRMRLRFDPPPDELATDHATYRLRFAPGQSATINVRASRNARSTALPASDARARAEAGARLVCRNPDVAAVLDRARDDLAMLRTDTEHGPYPYAGIPWFSTTFGRDGLITALSMLWLEPSLARGVLTRLAALQAHGDDPVTEAQRGKILHEMRQGEMAALREVPFGRYYGSADATPLFIVLAGAYVERTGDVGFGGWLWPHVRSAMEWMQTDGDRDGDGFIEYERMADPGLDNQGWKDSYDAVFHADGRLARGPIALVEVQSYAYAAFLAAARLASRLGFASIAAEAETRASELKRRFDEVFWCQSLKAYVLALDGQKQPCRVVTSNAGHALFSGIAAPERVHALANTLLGEQLYSGWGVRTVSTNSARYNPMSYHNGSVWPHDNAMIAAGLSRYARKGDAETLFESFTGAALQMEHRRLPELFCGFPRAGRRRPVTYPVACAPQAWAAGSLFMTLGSLLGIEMDGANRRVRIVEPRLPRCVEQLLVEGLQVGDASCDIGFLRTGSTTSVEIVRRSADLEVQLVSAATP